MVWGSNLAVTCCRGHCIAKKKTLFGASRSPARRKSYLELPKLPHLTGFLHDNAFPECSRDVNTHQGHHVHVSRQGSWRPEENSGEPMEMNKTPRVLLCSEIIPDTSLSVKSKDNLTLTRALLAGGGHDGLLHSYSYYPRSVAASLSAEKPTTNCKLGRAKPSVPVQRLLQICCGYVYLFPPRPQKYLKHLLSMHISSNISPTLVSAAAKTNVGEGLVHSNLAKSFGPGVGHDYHAVCIGGLFQFIHSISKTCIFASNS